MAFAVTSRGVSFNSFKTLSLLEIDENGMMVKRRNLRAELKKSYQRQYALSEIMPSLADLFDDMRTPWQINRLVLSPNGNYLSLFWRLNRAGLNRFHDPHSAFHGIVRSEQMEWISLEEHPRVSSDFWEANAVFDKDERALVLSTRGVVGDREKVKKKVRRFNLAELRPFGPSY